MQARPCVITALLLVCGAQGLRIAEDPSPEQQGIEVFSTDYYTFHDLMVIANSTVNIDVPDSGFEEFAGLKKMVVMGLFSGNEEDAEDLIVVVRAAYNALLGAVDMYADFDTWWSISFGDNTTVSETAYAEEILRLLKTEAKMGSYSEDTFGLDHANIVAYITGMDHDGIVSQANARKFMQALGQIGACDLAFPTGLTLPARWCVFPEEGTPVEKNGFMGLAPASVLLRTFPWFGVDPTQASEASQGAGDAADAAWMEDSMAR